MPGPFGLHRKADEFWETNFRLNKILLALWNGPCFPLRQQVAGNVTADCRGGLSLHATGPG